MVPVKNKVACAFVFQRSFPKAAILWPIVSRRFETRKYWIEGTAAHVPVTNLLVALLVHRVEVFY